LTDSQLVISGEKHIESDPDPGGHSLTRENMTGWTWMVSKGIGNAISGLSDMTGHRIRVNSLDLKWLSIKEAAMLLGGTDSPGIGIYLSFEGDAEGHLLLVHEPRVAFELIDRQLELPPGSTQQMGEMERAALEDIGNITGNCFLNSLADCADMTLMPSPPRIILDTVKAIMEIPLEYIGKEQENVLAVKATFSSDERQIDGSFLILPTMDFMKSILKKARIPPDLG
jgi:chemotaxis protein CheC